MIKVKKVEELVIKVGEVVMKLEKIKNVGLLITYLPVCIEIDGASIPMLLI